MADKYYDKPIDRHVDWGGDESTGGLPVTGRAVQEFIKNEFGTKFGYLNMRFNEAETMYYIECFANEDDYKKYEEDKEANASLRLQNVQIPISTAQGDTYTALLRSSLGNTSDIVITENKLEVPFNFRAIKISVVGNENAGYKGTLQIQRSNDNGVSWNDVGTLPNVLTSFDYDQTTEEKVDLGQFLTQGRQMLRVRASYTYQNEDGEEKVVNSSYVYVGASVTRTSLRLELVTPYNVPMYATNDETQAYNNFAVEYRVYGAVDKTLYVEVEGSLGTQTIELSVPALSNGDVKGISLPYSEAYGFHTHGVKKVKAWVVCNDGLGNTIKSDEMNNQFMMVADSANTQKYLLLQNVVSEVTNYIQTEFAQYAVYAPDGSETELSFQVQDTKGNVYTEATKKMAANTENEILLTMEIEPTDEGSVPEGYASRFYVFNGDDNMITSSGLNNYGYYDVYVDNQGAVVPVLGATFLMNPKNRDNSEEKPDQIFNAKANNLLVDSDWENFGFINDGWMTDENNQKVLRVMAGSKLTIYRNIWAKYLDTPNSAMTIEIDYKVSNVTNTEDPIVQIKGGTGNKGIILNALKGWVRTSSYTNDDNCMFAWREGQRQFLSVNLHNNVKPLGDGCIYPSNMEAQVNNTIALARVLLNGDPVREIPFDRTKAGEWCDDEDAAIVIGNEGADIDIYSIRVYENKAIDWADLQQRNYPSSMATTDEKLNFLEKNAIRLGQYISLEESMKKGLNCIVYHARRPYIHEKTNPDCWIEYHRYDQNGEYLPEYSGKNCEETVKRYRTEAKPSGLKTLSVKSQGSTAETYYEFNVQDNNSDVGVTIQVAVKDFHESISVRIEGDQAYIKGGNLGKNFPYEETEVAYPYANGYVTVPDGWIDGNGKYRGMGYMVAPGTALAQKKVAKINYASSMQSHLLGACKSYDELHFLCVGATPLQQAYLNKGLTRPVLAKHTEPFMMFWEENGVTTFTGLCIYGAAKMDKVAFGYVKKLMPMYSMIEGSDNNLPLTDFRVPFDEDVKTALKDGEMDGWTYNGETSFDYDAGATSDDDQDASPEIRKMWGKYHNFIYLNSTNIKVYDGTIEEFKLSDLATKDITNKYWCTTGTKAFHLIRYDFLTSQWVDAGLKGSDGNYAAVNLKTDLRTKATYEQYKSSTAYDEVNNAFKKVLADFFKAHGKFLMSLKSLLFNYNLVLRFKAGSDNSSKNTYYVIDPMVQDMSAEANDNFSAWHLATFGESFDYTKCYLVYMAGDDMDSIFELNNMGNLTKPYYVERLYPYADGSSECLYEGMNNSLFNLSEVAFTFDEHSSMMNDILSKMQSLVSNDDNLLALKDNKQSVWGFLHKYFFNIQYYFPQIAYLEQARIRYEFAEVMGHTGARGVRPISQSVGSNVENEMQFMEQRVVYMASFAEFGSLGNGTGAIGITDTTDQFAFRGSEMPDGSPSTFTFTITPHQYMYPCGFFGQTHKPSKQRTAPNQTCTITIASGVVGTPDAQMGIRGINYISDLGDLGDKSITSDLIVNGKRLTRIFVEWYTEGMFQPKAISITAINVKSLLLKPKYGTPSLDLSKLIRAKVINTNGAIGNIVYPKSTILQTIVSQYYPNVFYLEDVPNLANITIITYGYITNFHIGKNVGTNVEGFTVQSIVENIWNAQKSSANPRLKSIHVENVNWKDFDVEALSWFADRPTCEFKGTIAIKEDGVGGVPRVTWDLKNKFNAKFGVVDTKKHNRHKGLLLDYKRRAFNISNAKIIGNFYVESGTHFNFEVKPSSIYENDQTYVFFSEIRDSSYWFMNNLGTLIIYSLPDTQMFLDVKAIIYSFDDASGSEIYRGKVVKTIEIWNRPAQLGDLVYADGTFSSEESYDGEKTPIGKCFYVAPRNSDGTVNETFNNPNDKHLRLMVALENVKVPIDGTDTSSLQFGAYPINTGESDSFNAQYALYDLDSEGKKVNLTSESSNVSSVYDISAIRNLTSRGLTNAYINPDPSTNPNGASDYRDLNTVEGVTNDGFKCVTPDTAIGDGFAYNENATYLKERTLDEALAKLAGSGYKAGDIVNSGYAKTLKVIAHRNNLLSNNIIGAESAVIYTGGMFELPKASGTTTEMQALGALIDNLRAWAKNTLQDAYPNKWSQLCYPLVSACYAYEPKVKVGEVLADRFKAHNWFAPTEGLLARIQWYAKYGASQNMNIFGNAMASGLMSFSLTSIHWSVTEYGSNNSWYVNFNDGGTNYGFYKCYSYVGRAVAPF